MNTQAILVLSSVLVASAHGKPSFIFIQVEGRGWSSTSVRMEPDIPQSRNDYFRTPYLEHLAADGLPMNRPRLLATSQL